MISFLVISHDYRTIQYLMNYACEVVSKYSDRVVVDRTYHEISVNDILIKFVRYDKYESGSSVLYTNYFHETDFNEALTELDRNTAFAKEKLEKLLPEIWK